MGDRASRFGPVVADAVVAQIQFAQLAEVRRRGQCREPRVANHVPFQVECTNWRRAGHSASARARLAPFPRCGDRSCRRARPCGEDQRTHQADRARVAEAVALQQQPREPAGERAVEKRLQDDIGKTVAAQVEIAEGGQVCGIRQRRRPITPRPGLSLSRRCASR